jgi:hypothetical protein
MATVQNFSGEAIGYDELMGVWYNPLSWFSKPALKPVAVVKAKHQTSAKAVKTQVVADQVKKGASPEQAQATADAVVPEPGPAGFNFSFENPVVKYGAIGASALVLFTMLKKKKSSRR